MKTLASFFACLFVLVFARAAAAEPVRILVAAGSTHGLVEERPLKFADDDARRVRDVFVGLGNVRADAAQLVTEPDRAALFAAIDRARVEASKHTAGEVTFVFYFSGHGDRDAIHLAGDRLTFGDLTQKLGEVPASLRIAITDACRATRDKGFSADEPFAITATMTPAASGQVWIHASGDGEAAQESDDIEGAVFTHAWVSGLRGAADANGDARVTLEESFAFAHSQTLIRSAASSGVLQKPEAVMALRETGPIVLTQTGGAFATLSLPAARDTHYLVYSAGAKSVLSELWGVPDRRLVLRVPPGRYVVERQVGALGGSAQLAIGAREERALGDRDFTSGALPRLAAKGEPDAIATAPPARANEIAVGYDAGYSARTGAVHGPRATFAHAWGPLAVFAGGALELGDRTLVLDEEHLVLAYGRAGAELRTSARAFTFRAGVGGRLGALVQTVTPNGKASTTNTSLAAGPEASLAGRFALTETWFFNLAATSAVLVFREETTTRGFVTLTGGLTVGARF